MRPALPRADPNRATMPIQFKTSGCLASIVLSIGLTILLNLLIRSC